MPYCVCERGGGVRHDRAAFCDAKPGDRVMAGAGMHAELVGGGDTAVVRWLQYDDGRWWGYQHSRVPWSTIQPWRER